MSKTDFLDTQRSAVNVEEVKEVHLLMFGRQPMSSISSWHPSTRSLMNLSVRESPMSSQLRFYRVTSHISHIVHKTHSYRDEHSHSGPWSQVCIVGGGVTSAVSPCPELTHAALNLRQTDTYWVENLGDKSCFHQTRSHMGLGLGWRAITRSV